MEDYTDIFVRNSFEDGMMLSAADLNNLQSYLDGKRRMGYRELIGWGIICGFSVKGSFDRIIVEPGLAVDRKGRELYLQEAAVVRLGSLFPRGAESGEWFLCIEYDEEPFGESFVITGEKLSKAIHNRIIEKHKYIVKKQRGNGDVCLARLIMERKDGVSRISSVLPSGEAFRFSQLLKDFLPEYKSGLVYIDEKLMSNEDGVLRTGEIYHGLGPGRDVMLELTVKTYDEWRACEVVGDPGLFGLAVRTAAKLYPESGTFIIAVKPLAPLTAPICVRWRARALREAHGHA